MTSLETYNFKQLAEMEGTYPIKIARHRKDYVQINIPFGNKGRVMRRYLSREDSTTFNKNKNV